MDYLVATVLPECADQGPPALVVGHGFAFKTVLRALLGASPWMTRNVHLDNTGLIELACRPAGVPDSKGRVADTHTWYILRYVLLILVAFHCHCYCAGSMTRRTCVWGRARRRFPRASTH